MPKKQFFYFFIAILGFLFLMIGSAQALPRAVSYQGKLTGSDGSPVPDGAYTVMFSIYNEATSGDQLWVEEQNVMVKDGVFNVKLPGNPDVNPFPGNLLDSEKLYLSIRVGADQEMAPRQEITSTFYALKAGDADSVGGISSGQLVQTGDLDAHTADPSAHHTKTTSFSELTDQIADSQIPASITRDTEFNDALTAHAANSSAHHARYSNTEAVQAMGKKEDKNPLNHDRYSDIEAVKAILASDGPGSGLDADLLDGQHADDIISAATDEVRSAISGCGVTISAPGSYYLTGNLSCTGHGVTIASNDVTLDLMGFTISGDGEANEYGIYINGASNVEIKNGTVRGFDIGVYATNTGNYIRVINLRMSHNGDGMHLLSRGNIIKSCSAGENQADGFFIGAGSVVSNNTAYKNSGTGLFIGYGSTVTGNTAFDNTTVGIDAGTGSTLTDNIAYSNDGVGIKVGTASVVTHNSSSHNAVGIEVAAGSTLTNNTCFKNNSWGIVVDNFANYPGETSVTNNSVTYNNDANTSGQGGIRVPSNCYVKGNSLSFNNVRNIYVDGSHNIIEENLVTHSGDGIYFNGTGNFWANNRASANTNNFVNTTGQTSGGGNYGF